MGSSQSQQSMCTLEEGYISEQRGSHPFFGPHKFLINRGKKEMIICKQLTFHSSSQFNQFEQQFKKIQRKPFSIIYPKAMIKTAGFQSCSNLYEISLYFDLVGKSLLNVVKNQGVLSEGKAWFLLNEVSKSLEILAQSNRPHWAISPENIFQNSYQNYFIYDSFFVLGLDPHNFLTKKLDNRELMSEKMQIQIQRGLGAGLSDGLQEDCYCLGFTILFALTGIASGSLPKESQQRALAVKNILMERRGQISVQMMQMILLLTEKDPLRRMDNHQLRRILKDKQADIIHNQQRQFQKSRQRELPSKRQFKDPHHVHQMGSPQISQPSMQTIHYVNTNSYSASRMIPREMKLVEIPQAVPVERFSVTPFRKYTADQPQFVNQPNVMESPSDRSKALTRINSYDRLIPRR